MNFISDNAYGAAPEILSAIAEANRGTAPSYGGDEATARLQKRFCEVFEREVFVFPVATGTAANALAIASVCPPYGAVFCHAESHIAVDECGAVEFFAGGARLIGLAGDAAKIAPAALEAAVAACASPPHSPKPAAVSITQSTEMGTLYSADEIAAIAASAHRNGMKLHMDGARFANAVAALGCRPADIAWRAGVDILSFGATKNGALGAEAIVFFSEADCADFAYRRKKSGHLLSKSRFVAAQLEAYLAGDRWLSWAAQSNALAAKLAKGLSAIPGVELAQPAQCNAVFAWLPEAMAQSLRAHGAAFYDWRPAHDGRVLARLVLSFLTPQDAIDRFLALAGRMANGK